jgi:uncharacterized coiled-coil protein SlyX
MSSQGEKKQVAVRIPLRQKAELEFEAAERDVSRSEYIRGILGQRHRVGELEERLATREDRIDELEEQLARRSQVEEKVDVLANRVKEQTDPDPPWPIRWYQYFRGGDE